MSKKARLYEVTVRESFTFQLEERSAEHAEVHVMNTQFGGNYEDRDVEVTIVCPNDDCRWAKNSIDAKTCADCGHTL